MKKIGIACLNYNNAIGLSNKLIYRIPSELKFFKKTTINSHNNSNLIVMGRKTFESLNKSPLQNRMNYVISTQSDILNKEYKNIDNLLFFNSIDKCLEYSKTHTFNNMFICGGTSIYKYFIDNNLLDYLLITKINKPCLDLGDVFFPDFTDKFKLIDTESHINKSGTQILTNDKHLFDYSINTYINLTRFTNNEKYKIFYHKKNNHKYNPLINNLIMPEHQAVSYSTIANSQYNSEYNYLNQLRNVLENGKIRETRNSKTLSIFGINMDFDISKTIPLLTTKKIYWKGIINELLWFLKGQTNNKYLQDNKVYIWNGNSSREFLDSRNLEHLKEGDCGPIYGFQWRHFNAKYVDCNSDYTSKGIDQFQNVINTINTDPMSRRMIISAWNPCQLDEMCLPPCHVLYQFYVSINSDGDKCLSCSMYQRSGDMFLGVPFNIASTATLTYIIANITNCKPDKITIKIGDAHIYESHIDAVNKQLSREPTYFPTLEIKNKSKNIEDYIVDDFIINDYNCQSAIKAPMVA